MKNQVNKNQNDTISSSKRWLHTIHPLLVSQKMHEWDDIAHPDDITQPSVKVDWQFLSDWTTKKSYSADNKPTIIIYRYSEWISLTMTCNKVFMLTFKRQFESRKCSAWNSGSTSTKTKKSNFGSHTILIWNNLSWLL